MLQRSQTSDAIDEANANIFSKTFQLVYDYLQSMRKKNEKINKLLNKKNNNNSNYSIAWYPPGDKTGRYEISPKF